MSGLVSIDPGLHSCGVAFWSEAHTLIWAGLVKNRVDVHPSNPTYHQSIWNGMVDAVDAEMHVLGYAPDRLALELPQVYRAVRSKGDPADLIMLAGVVGGLVQWFHGTSYLCLPHDWKKSVPKPVMEERISKRLNDTEKHNIQKAPKSLMHNIWDSVGIGLHHLKRL